VAKLLIFRGETLHAETELTEQTVRIGRSEQNEIVLDDPSKGVSRTHAEIRYEDGRHVLVDNESQNGIWVRGARLSSVVLAPDVVATLGPYRLRLDASMPSAVVVYPSDTPTEFAGIADHPTAPLLPGDQGRLPESRTRRRVAEPAARRPWHQQRLWLIGGAAAAVLLTTLGLAMYMGGQSRRPTFDLALATAMVDAGSCQQATSEHIDPALTADPRNAEALALRRRCAAPPPPPPPPPPPVPTSTTELNEADALIAANECAQALDKINAVLVGDPNDERAKASAVKATACLPPAPPQMAPRAPNEALAVAEPASQGGLELLPKERAKDYGKRKLAMRQRYDDALSMIDRGEYPQAVAELEAIGGQVPAGYMQLAERLAQARDSIKQAAARSFDEGQAAEKNGTFDAALTAYRRAHALDPSILIDGPVQRIQDQKIRLGKKRCEEAKVAFSYGENTTAAAAFQDVVKLLPQSDPCYALARDRLTQLGR
jgi:tetratricopeptide (TPR) repeat protein